MNIKGKALLAGCIALAFSNMALAEDIKAVSYTHLTLPTN